jgi:homoserine kinase
MSGGDGGEGGPPPEPRMSGPARGGATPKAGPALVRVRAPATSANLGPGFDAAGVALDWWDSLEVRRAPVTSIRIAGEQAEAIAVGEDNLVLRAMRHLAASVGEELPPVHLNLVKAFPLGRGFGSSAAAVVLGLLAARSLLAPDLPDAAMLALAAELEGHPDNVAPCLAGGATLCWSEGGGVRSRGILLHPDLVALALVASEPMATAVARRLLPAEVPFAVAARTAGRAALLAPALGGDFDLLLPATEDVLHQPARLAVAPTSGRVLEALRDRGQAAFLSGAGPSLLVLCARSARTGAGADAEEALKIAGADGWQVRRLELARIGANAQLEREPG